MTLPPANEDELAEDLARDEIMQLATRLLAGARAGRNEDVERAFATIPFPDEIEFCLQAGAMLASPSDAKWFIDQAVRLAPQDGDVVTRAAEKLYHHGFRDEAADLTERAKRLEPFELSAARSYLVGVMARDEGATERAEEAFAAAFHDRPKERDMVSTTRCVSRTDSGPEKHYLSLIPRCGIVLKMRACWTCAEY